MTIDRANGRTQFFCSRCNSELSRDVYLAGTCGCAKGTTENLAGTERGLRLAIHEVRRVLLSEPALEARRKLLQSQLERLALELADIRSESGT